MSIQQVTKIRAGLRPRVRRVLDRIDTMLAHEGGRQSHKYDGEQLWDILSALRGPDDHRDEDLKHTHTTILRSLAFPKTMVKGGTSRAMFAEVYRSGRVPSERKGMPYGYDGGTAVSHFETHLNRAIKAFQNNKTDDDGFVTRPAKKKRKPAKRKKPTFRAVAQIPISLRKKPTRRRR